MERIAIRIVAILWIVSLGPALAQTVTVDRSATGSAIVFAWPSAVDATWRQQGDELLLSFGRPVEALDLGDLQRRLSAWLDSVSAGYDSVLFRALPGVKFAVAATPQGVTVSLSRAPAMSGDAAAERRLEQLRARLEAESGKEADAEARLSALARGAPQDADIMLQRAGVAEKLGRWPRALALHDQALQVRPDDAEAREARRRLARERQSQVRIEPDYQRVHGGDRQWMLRGSAFYYPEAGRVGGTAVEARHISDGNLRRLDGGSGPADLWREKAELFYGVDVGVGGQVVGRLLASTGTPGAGVEWTERRSGFEARLGSAYREAYWDMKEAIPASATVDKVYGRAQWTPLDDITVAGGLSANRYGVKDDVDVARTARWDLGLRRGLKLGGDEASLGYTVDAETVGHRDTRISSAGVGYRTLPVRSRETHSVDLTLRHEFAFETWVTAQAGWSFDRLTDAKGPLGNVKFSHEPAQNVEAGLKIGFAHTTGRGSDGLSRGAGAYVAVRF